MSECCTVGQVIVSAGIGGLIMRCGGISLCQSAATSEIVKRCGHESQSCKQRYGQYPDLYLYQTFTYSTG